MYTPNYPDFILGGIIGAIIAKLVDAVLKNVKSLDQSLRLRNKLKEINEKQYSNILALDHAETSYQPTDIKIQLTPVSLYYSPSIELRDKIISLFGSKAFKKKDYGLKDFNFSKINNFKHHLEINKMHITSQFIDSANKVHPLFNGQKLGIQNIKIKRVPDSDRAQLIIDLYKTDYFTHKVARSFYRWLNSSLGIASQIDLEFFHHNFNDYKFLNTSLGIYITVQVNEGFVLCKRSAIVSNIEEAGKWHISVDEGLDIQDLKQDKVDILQFAERGLLEELGLSRSILDKYMDGKIRFLDIFLEKKRYEIILAAYLKLNISMEKLKEFYRTAKDGEYETTDIICVENDASKVEKFFSKNNVTDMAKYCIERILARELF